MTVSKGDNQTLKATLAGCAAAIGDCLRSLINRPLQVRVQAVGEVAPATFLGRMRTQAALVRGTLDGQVKEPVRIVMEAGEAATLVAYTTMVADEIVQQKRAIGRLEGDDLDAFAAVANVVCAALDAVVRERLGADASVGLQDHGVLEPGLTASPLLGNQPLVEVSLTLAIERLTPTTAYLLVSHATAERWNRGPIDLADLREHDDIDQDDDIPAAPLRGRLAAYLVDNLAIATLRRSCRRIGLELTRHSRNEVPNPAAHRDDIVLLEVVPGEERRFEWLKRIKAHRSSIRVVVLLRVPSRGHVLQGLRAGGDVIIGHPFTERQLSQKLGTLLDPLPEPAPPAEPEPTASE